MRHMITKWTIAIYLDVMAKVKLEESEKAVCIF